jgi:hypothetical protein
LFQFSRTAVLASSSVGSRPCSFITPGPRARRRSSSTAELRLCGCNVFVDATDLKPAAADLEVWRLGKAVRDACRADGEHWRSKNGPR